MSKPDRQMKLRQAVSLHQAGRGAEAAKLYRQVIAKDPGNAFALHYLGSIEAQNGRFDEAKALMLRSLSSQPDNPQFIENYATVLFQSGDYQSALDACRQGLRLDGGNVPLLYVGAISSYKLGRLDDAIGLFDGVLRLAPNHVAALNERGSALAEREQYDAALASIDRALALQPDYAAAHLNKGNVYGRLERYDDALAAYQRAIALQPRMGDAWLGRANVLRATGQPEDAIASYDKALALNGDPNGAWLGRGMALAELRRPDEAVAAFDEVISRDPNSAEAWLGRGMSLVECKSYDDALAAFDRAIALRPGHADTHMRKSLCLLLLGRFEDGWPAYEWRAKIQDRSAPDAVRQLAISEFVARDQLRGRHVGVVCEQGVGDEIMFGSILPDLVEDAAAITYQVDPRLVGIFTRRFPSVAFITKTQTERLQSQGCDLLVRAGSLGYAYRRQAADFPRRAYLAADSAIVERWRGALAPCRGRFKVGLSWRGGADPKDRDRRSIALAQARPLLERDDCVFVSLQYGDVAAEISQFNEQTGRQILSYPAQEIDDFDELTGLIEALDMVVSVQNTTVHLCGALGKACLAMLPWRPEWRYGDRDGEMVWYSPQVQLIRQNSPGNWSDLLAAVGARLSAAIEQAS